MSITLQQLLLSMGGVNTTPGKPFTPGTINYIMGNAGLMTTANISRVLHRSEKSVRRFAERQGVSLKVQL